MKKILLSISTVALVSITVYAGKNTMPVPSKPIEVPPSPTKSDSTLPLGLYLGGGLTYASTECKCQDITLTKNEVPKNEGKSYGVNLKAGYDFNEFIGIEGKYLHTPWGDEGKALKHYGVYLKPNYTVSEYIDIYGLLGYGKTDCESLKEAKKGFSWGLGGEYTLNKKKGKNSGVGIYAEYLQPLKKSSPNEIKTNVANVGIAYHY